MLGNNICLLALGGSKAYGTNIETSDTDIRGIAINPLNQIYGLQKDFEQIVDTNTDTTIYSLNKMINLLINCNPNTIEILGCRPEDYLYVNDYGKLILDNKQNFLSIRATKTFGEYARSQFNRLEHVLLGNGANDEKRLEMLKYSLACAIESFNLFHNNNEINLYLSILTEDEYIKKMNLQFNEEKTKLKSEYTKKLVNAKNESEIQSFTDLYHNDLKKINTKYTYKIEHPEDAINERIIISGNFKDYSIGNLQTILRDLNKIKSEYGQINKTNAKKTDMKLAKHMMHLIRLYMMGIKLNSEMDIHTHWDGKDQQLLLDIRNGKYMYGEGMKVRPEFYELMKEIEAEYDYSVKHTILPETPNYEAINEMLNTIYINKFNNEQIQNLEIDKDCER